MKKRIFYSNKMTQKKYFYVKLLNFNIKTLTGIVGFNIDFPNTVNISHKNYSTNHIIPSTNQRSRNE